MGWDRAGRWPRRREAARSRGGAAGRALLAVGLFLAATLAEPSDARDSRYGAIDAGARAAPASSTTSVAELARYLGQRTRGEREKARAAFSWITHSVGYDGSLTRERADPEVVLARRSAACYGYARLFEALVEGMGLEAEVIIGHGKGSAYEPGQSLDAAENHAWNAVKIGGKWHLVDCTWGAGHIEEGGRFVRRFTDHYFLTPPEDFAWDHLPDDERWQLLATPVSREEYANRVSVRAPFFERGLSLVDQRSAVIEADGAASVTIGAPRDTVVTAALYQGGRQLARHYTFTQREEGGFVVRAAFPSRGRYMLRVFARARDAVGQEYDTALMYAVEARSGGGSKVGFPEVYDAFLVRECRLERPVSREIAAGAKVEFAVRAPRAEEMVVVRSDGVWWVLDKRGERFAGEVLMEPGEVTVFAKFPGKRRYDGLLRYAAR